MRIKERLENAFASELFTFDQLKKIFIPLIFDQASIYIIAMLSTAMVSTANMEGFAGINLVSPLMFICSAVFTCLATGGSIVVAQAKGSRDEAALRRSTGQSILLCSFFGLIITFILLFFGEAMVHLFFSDATKNQPDMIKYAVQYLRIMGLSFFPFAIFQAVFSVFRGIGDSKSSLVLTVVINGVHLILSYLYIVILDLGVVGSALSYVTARVIGAIIALVWLFRVNQNVRIHMKDILTFDKKISLRITLLSVPILIEQVIFQAGMLVNQIFMSKLEELQITANAVASNAYNIYLAVAMGLQSLTMTVCGQCVGAGCKDLFKKYLNSLRKYGRLIMLIDIIVITPFMPLILKLYSAQPDQLPLIYKVTAIGAVFLPIIWCEANITPAALKSAGDTSVTTVFSIVALWTGRVTIGGLLLVETLKLGAVGAWIGMTVEMFIRAALCHVRYKKEKWAVKAFHEN